MSTTDGFETEAAVRALGARLRDWGVPQPGAKARAFIDDLRQRGWKPGMTRVPRNPRPDEECPRHVGQFATACGPCISEAKGGEGYGHDEQPASVPAGGWNAARIRESIRRLEESKP